MTVSTLARDQWYRRKISRSECSGHIRRLPGGAGLVHRHSDDHAPETEGQWGHSMFVLTTLWLYTMDYGAWISKYFVSKKQTGADAAGSTDPAAIFAFESWQIWFYWSLTKNKILLSSPLQILENTLVIFTSDNGPSLARHERGGCAGLFRSVGAIHWREHNR